MVDHLVENKKGLKLICLSPFIFLVAREGDGDSPLPAQPSFAGISNDRGGISPHAPDNDLVCTGKDWTSSLCNNAEAQGQGVFVGLEAALAMNGIMLLCSNLLYLLTILHVAPTCRTLTLESRHRRNTTIRPIPDRVVGNREPMSTFCRQDFLILKFKMSFFRDVALKGKAG